MNEVSMDEYLKTMAGISGELWKVFKAACQTMDTNVDSWWEKLSDDLDSVAKKYYGTEYEKYARNYATILVYEVERKAKA
jgi:hypothetical protein